MEDQGKRLLLAVVAAFAVMMAWMVLFPPDKPEQAPTPEQPTGEVTPAAPGEVAPTPDGAPAAPLEPGEVAPAPAAEPAAPAARGEEEIHAFAFEEFVARFSTHGGALVDWELQGTKYEDRKSHRSDAQIDLVPHGEREDLRPFLIRFENSTLSLPEQTEWRVESKTDTEIVFVWSSADLRVEKHYKMFPADYLVQLTVSLTKLSEGPASQQLAISTFGYQDPTASTGGGFTSVKTVWQAACAVEGEVRTWDVKDLSAPQVRAGQVKWAGVTHSYFFSAMSPRPSTDAVLTCIASRIPDLPGAMRVDLVFPQRKLSGAGDGYDRTVTAYIGPKYLDKLESISGLVGYDTGFDKAIDLGWFSFIARPLLWLMLWFQGFVVNWGIAIILLTCLVKLATLYWTHKSMKSMKAMAKLKPEIEKIQKKFKDDKQRQQVEIMNMYKAHKVNPLAGCLPMLLQMPIWFALYRMLMAAAELYQAPFIPGWIDDLTSPDPFFILPIALMGMMFLQAKLQPTPASSTQQKVMMYGLPLMFGFFSIFFPSGLTLYIFTNTVLTLFHQMWMNRHEPRPGKATAAVGGAAATLGRAEDDEDEDDEGGEPDDGPATAGNGTPGQARKKTGQRRGRGGRRKRK
jgi:YidC/Oxa1 family membrane protein insertase